MKQELTAERLRELLSYDMETGIFTRIVSRSGAGKVGSAVGNLKKHGYLNMMIDGKIYLAHRLAWLYVHGVWPTNHIDHKNGNRIENWIANLRDVTRVVNRQNQRTPNRDSMTGFLGVTWNKRCKKFMAQINSNGICTYLGLFKSAEDAHDAYLIAKRMQHVGCTI